MILGRSHNRSPLQEMQFARNRSDEFSIDPFNKKNLSEGLDPLGYLRQFEKEDQCSLNKKSTRRVCFGYPLPELSGSRLVAVGFISVDFYYKG